MQLYSIVLRGLAIGVFAVALIHILLGVSAEPLLGSAVSNISQADPSLDSQNRFYGAAFSLFGGLWWLSSGEVAKYQTVLKLSFLIFFLAGASRLISVGILGLPSIPITVLTLVELAGPIIMLLWLNKVLRDA